MRMINRELWIITLMFGALAGCGGNGGGSAAASGGSASGVGGNSAQGGSSTSGATAFRCDNLSLAPATRGQPKPAGAVGGIKVLDWAGFTGAVSFTFDDNTSSQMPNYAALRATGGHFTFFVVSGWLSGTPDAPKFKATLADGQEIANHTKSHQAQANQADLQAAEDWISQNMGVTASSMAAPNGDTSWNSVAPSVVFQNRGVIDALVKPRDSSDPFHLPAYIPPSGASSSTMDAEVTSAKTANAWRIFCIHGFDNQNGTYQPVPIENVTATMSNAVNAGMWVEGITNVGAYWAGQKLISASASTSAKWTLPAHFPANMCVRITTTGGTVTQNGAEVPWDDHGYYQISLDAGSVTIQ